MIDSLIRDFKINDLMNLIMHKINVELEEGNRTIEVKDKTRLVLVLEDNGVDISHRCGGNARCTTCRCVVSSNTSLKMTKAEADKLREKRETDPTIDENVRLSCQILVESDMTVKPLQRVKDMNWNEPGKRPENHITPEPIWI
jgi:ferredoxin